MDTARERLFFALLPPPDARTALERTAAELRAFAALRGKWLKPDKYHVTLPFLGTFPAVPADLIERAKTAAASVRAAPFTLVLDRLDSFVRRRQSPCVLHAAVTCLPDLRALHGALSAALAAQGVTAESGRDYVPHLTLAYGELAHRRRLAAPVAWPVHSFALMRSRVTQGIHECLGEWTLVR
jgi:2'-5' RNA ligase